MATPAYRFEDPTKGMELVTSVGPDREHTRYVFSAIDVLNPERKEEIERLQGGGEEVSSHCLRRTPNFVPKCVITPVELWKEDMALELVPDGVSSVTVTDPAESQEVMGNPIQFMLRGKPLRSIRTYPGEELPGILSEGRGIVELQALKNTDWNAGVAQEVQAAFFPLNQRVPVAFSAIEKRIEEVGTNFPNIANGMSLSVSKSRRWALLRVGLEHQLLDTRKEHQWTYTYSPVAHQLLAQLEMSPRGEGFQTLMAQGILSQSQAFAQAMSNQNSQMSITDLATAIATAIVAAQQAGKPVEQMIEEMAELPCEWCGKTFGTAQGVALHKTRHCENKPE